MIQTNLLQPGHSDLVTFVTYDFYGERLATCSADRSIKLFRRSAEGAWNPETEWKAHNAPISRLSFAHPLHGSLLASGSHDRTVRIWEEPTGRLEGAVSSKDGLAGQARWVERAVLGGMKGSVKVVEFSPPNPAVGLRVASIATDSHLRIHTSLDPDLSDWSIAHDVYVPSLAAPGGDESAAHETSTNHTTELAQGSWGLSWCKENWWGSVVAVFTGVNPTVKIIRLDPTPTAVLYLTPGEPRAPLTSMSWAPSCGRSYHLLATGARDGTVRIWRVEPPDTEIDEGKRDGWKAEVIGEFGRGGARIGMVDWNAMGTMLTVSDDEGTIRIYKATYGRTWKLFGKMTAEEPPTEDAGGA